MKKKLGSDKLWQLALVFLKVVLSVAGQFALAAVLHHCGWR